MKCKHCCQQLVEVAGFFLDPGVILRSVCMLSDVKLHQPEIKNNEEENE